MTDRYSWHTGHPELAIVATRDLLPLSGTHSFGHRIRWGKAFADDNEPWDKTDRKMKRSQRINTDPLLTELTGGLAQLPYSMRKDIDDLDEHEYYPEPAEVIDLDAPLEIIESAFEDELLSESTGAESKVVEVAEEEVKMRDFSIVQSSRHVSSRMAPGWVSGAHRLVLSPGYHVVPRSRAVLERKFKG
jgi:hypothetical protein